MVDTTLLREKAKAIYIAVEKPVADNLSQTFLETADEIDELRLKVESLTNELSFLRESYHRMCFS